MTPAPYTPDTLKRMRAGATARDLGWDQQRYERVCKEQGIEIVKPWVKQAAVDREAQVAELDRLLKESQAIADRRRENPPVTIAQPASTGPIKWMRLTGEIERGRRLIALSRMQANIFAILYRSMTCGETAFLPGDGFGIPMGSVSSTAAAMNAKLKPLNLRIDSKNGKTGGYRLVDLSEPKSEVASVASVSAPIKQED